MENLISPSVHAFHIPVMGTGFSIDTPLRVAKYGISSAVSLVDDILIEQMRKHHCEKEGEPYEAISDRDDDARAQRITAYLDLLDRLIQRQVAQLQSSPFEAGSEITRYFEMLPPSPLKHFYDDMLAASDPAEKARMQGQLRRLAAPGGIDVNIMSKLDRDAYRNGRKLPPEFCAAMAALRGYANSSLRSSVIFSAGMNARLYGYVSRFEDFFPDDDGVLKKKIVLKVSDYRSALIQGRFLAKRGLWVSEYRIESGLNCGGHAFATQGLLMGPILEEFEQKKEELTGRLHAAYVKALASSGRSPIQSPHEVRITAQGGVGTAAEHEQLLDCFDVDAVGWGTPFLLVPEVTNVDEEHRRKLAAATDGDVLLSDSSPLGIPFWSLSDSASEENRRRRIEQGKPGSVCPKHHIRLNSEFTEIPICTASHAYQKRKLRRLQEEGLSTDQLAAVREQVLAKSCICHDLGGGAAINCDIDPDASPAVCPGPGIADFSRIATLEEMVGHIYGRLSLLTNPDRPHMFIRELALYVDCLRNEMGKFSLGLSSRSSDYFHGFKENLLNGVDYYRGLADRLIETERDRFLDQLTALCEAMEPMATVAVG